jgi:signal transduction histidine kinase
VCETLQPVTVIHEHVQPGGRKRIVEIIAAPLMEGDGQLAGVVESVRDITERKRAEQSLQESERRYRTLNAKNKELLEGIRRQFLQRGELLKKLITVQEDERKRVARELHDELGQALSGLALQTAAMKKSILVDPHGASQQLDDICALIAQTTNQMYNLILSLRPAALDDLGLTTALYNCADHLLTDAAIRFEFDAEGLTHRLSPEIETILYRIFQEALSNIVRHAQATQVGIRLALREGLFEGPIEDNGRGFDPETVLTNKHDRSGLGLLGMQERATQCGGRLEVISQPGKGTCIRVIIPIREGMLHE